MQPCVNWPRWTRAHDQLARALADHPSESDLPILIGANFSRSQYHESCDERAAEDQGQPARSRGSGQPDPPGPAVGPVQPARARRAGQRWTGMPGPPASSSIEQALSAWEDVYHKRYPTAGTLSVTEAPALMLTICPSSSTTCCGVR